MVSPTIEFNTIRGRELSATYRNLPSGSKIVLVDKVTGVALRDPVVTVRARFPLFGRLLALLPVHIHIILPDAVRPGGYYLQALNQDGGFLAQTVEFYVADLNPAPGPGL
jgi:hypothetical protein